MTAGRVLIAGTHSGCGKTTVTVAVIAALRAKGIALSSFKCGPDYIDPMFHRAALGVTAHNLDPYFCSPQALAGQVAEHGRGKLSVIEGVMGYYDGIGVTSRASSYDVAQAVAAPVVLVLDVRGMAASAGAVLQGFTGFRTPSQLQGVIVNQTSAAGYAFYAEIIRAAGLRPLGFLPRRERLSWPSRRLGLVTAAELDQLDATISDLARLAEENLDLDALLELASAAPGLAESVQPSQPTRLAGPGVRVAVARDEAFCFSYAETLELLQRLGAELVFFSPIHDESLPDCAGLYLPGGYPEHHLAALSGNTAMLRGVRERIGQGLPTIAECGGFMYLHRDIDAYPMAGVIDGSAFSTPRLQRFGYATLTAQRDNLLAAAGESMPVHEFHYYDSTANGDAFNAVKASTQDSYPVGHASGTLYAGFPHLYLPAVPAAAARFIDQARIFAK
jgi:cobyrinic acid a,c-diamide synthase